MRPWKPQAGEKGRGFAAVAREVRSLAQRSAASAWQIKQIITTSGQQLHAGMDPLDKACTTVSAIVDSIAKVHDIISEINSASVEHSPDVRQVAQAVTPQDAALVEESAAAAESLKTQSQQLLDAVAVFRLSNEMHPNVLTGT